MASESFAPTPSIERQIAALEREVARRATWLKRETAAGRDAATLVQVELGLNEIIAAAQTLRIVASLKMRSEGEVVAEAIDVLRALGG